MAMNSNEDSQWYSTDCGEERPTENEIFPICFQCGQPCEGPRVSAKPLCDGCDEERNAEMQATEGEEEVS